jgi:hypothetical protein
MKIDYEELFKKNYAGYAFDEPGYGYAKKYLKTKEGKKDLKRDKKSSKKLQKQLVNDGFDSSETWSLDTTIAKFVYPRIKHLRKIVHGYPHELSEKKWDKILKKMEYSFMMLQDEIDDYEETYPRIEKGLQLFAKYFVHLWD